jgi:hypothetical protein
MLSTTDRTDRTNKSMGTDMNNIPDYNMESQDDITIIK